MFTKKGGRGSQGKKIFFPKKSVTNAWEEGVSDYICHTYDDIT